MSTARWTRAARADLEAVDDHYRALDVPFADRVTGAAIAAGRFLAANPRAGPVVGGTIRKWRLSGFDFILLYRVIPGGVQVVRLHHVRQNWRPEP